MLWVSMCSRCQEQITTTIGIQGPWYHTVWIGLGLPPELREPCPTVPNSIATPTEGMILEFES